MKARVQQAAIAAALVLVPPALTPQATGVTARAQQTPVAPAAGDAAGDVAAVHLPTAFAGFGDMAPVSFADDAAVAGWGAVWLAGGREGYVAILPQVGAALRDEAVPQARLVWFAINRALGHFDNGQRPAPPPGLSPAQAAALDLAIDIYLLDAERAEGDATPLIRRALDIGLADHEALQILLLAAQPPELERLQQLAATQFPADFGMAWMLRGASALAPPQTPVGAFQRWWQANPDAALPEVLAALAVWQQAVPEDPNLIRRIAYQHAAAQRHEQALDGFRRAEARYPFQPIYAELIGQQLARMRAFDTLPSQISARMDHALPAPQARAETAATHALTLRLAGELGRARSIALAAAEAGDDSPRLRIELARTALAEDRPAEAVDILLPLAEADPGHRLAWSELARALQAAGRPADAAGVVQIWASRAQRLTADQLDIWRRALAAQDQRGQMRALRDLGLRDAPRDEWAIANFSAEINATEGAAAAYDFLAERLAAGRYTPWSAGRLAGLATAAGREDEARALINGQIARAPGSEALWSARASLAAGPDAVWIRARAAAPQAAFPWVRLARLHQGPDSTGWRAALSVLDEGIATLETSAAPAGERMKLYDARALLRDEVIRLFPGPDPDETARLALDDLDRARALGLGEADYWRARAITLGRLDHGPDFVRAAWASFATDDEPRWNNLFTDSVRDSLISPQLGFVLAQDWLDRRPRDAARLIEIARHHALYGGSPVVALDLLARAEQADPDAETAGLKGEALARLGLAREAFEARYAGAGSIASSDRYIGWFDTARRNARTPQYDLQRLDTARSTVVLRRPDGVEEERHYHPVTGKLIHLRIGAATVDFDYDNGLELVAITTGNGDRLRLDHADAPFDPVLGRQITRMEVTGQPVLSFAYAEPPIEPSHQAGPKLQTAPVMIAIAGLGRVDITYDETGEITDVQATPDDPATPPEEVGAQATRAIQAMLVLTRLAQAGSGFGELPFHDGELAALRQHWQDSDADPQAGLALARRLLEQRGAHPDHADEFYGVTDVLLADLIHGRPPAPGPTLEAIGLWQDMSREVYGAGLPPDLWQDWLAMRNWALAQSPATLPGAEAVQRRIHDAPLRAASTSGWLRTSFLTNPGMWRHHKPAAIVPPALAAEAEIGALLIRANGDLVAGTRRGLSVLRKGFWEWHGFDRASARFLPMPDYDRVDGASAITALHEDADGRLWIGTRAGLARMDDGYDAQVGFAPAGSGGIPEGGVSALIRVRGALWIGGPGGLSRQDPGSDRPALLDRDEVLWLRDLGAAGVAVGRQDRVELHRGGQVHPLAHERLGDVWLRDGRLLAIRGAQVVEAAMPASGAVERLTPLPEQETIAHSGRLFGFAELPVLAGETALGVLTDQGISILRQGRFEHLTLPGQDRIEPVSRIAIRGAQLMLANGRGISVMERDRARQVTAERPLALLSVPDWGVTLVATGWGIQAIAQDDPFAAPTTFATTETRAMDLAPDGSVIVSDGRAVLRLRRNAEGGFDRELLFETDAAGPNPLNRSTRVSQILAAADGTVWAIAGASLYRHAPEGARTPGLREFSALLDQADFPVRSDLLSQLVETHDGRIWLVASDEGHRGHPRPRTGGLYQYSGTGFAPVGEEVAANWFLTGYTPVGKGRAIVGTAGGFALHGDQRLAGFGAEQNASYLALSQRMPGLHLGTQGAGLGDGTYLFGSASGVVAWSNGMWFLPERLNWMLPEQQYAVYGGRRVHAIATDPQGRVYMGTDFGVTVHDPKGAGPASFLIDEGQGAAAFGALEAAKMEEVRDVLLDTLPEDGAEGMQLRNLRSNRAELAQVETAIDLVSARGASAQGAAASGTEGAGGDTAALSRRALQLRQRDIALLADLERREPKLFSLLQVNPLDLQALRRDLPEGMAVLQFLPAETELHLNLISRDEQVLRQVATPRAALETRARRAVEGMAAQARLPMAGGRPKGPAAGSGPAAGPAADTDGGIAGLLGGTGAGLGGGLGLGDSGGGIVGAGGGLGLPAGDGGLIAAPSKPAMARSAAPLTPTDTPGDDLTEDLAWLYDQLLRPVEHELAGFEVVLVAPAGSLHYLPTGALIRDREGPAPRHAAQDFTFAQLPSLYALQGISRPRGGNGTGHLVLGDPDGSLPHARIEADEVAGLLQSDGVSLRIGDAASYPALQEDATTARFVHLAMHGKLDEAEPRNSHLLLAANWRLTLPQIMTLPLSNAELVFLSACQTGLGADGLEHRTIAQAFSHAGAPTVIASHWEVNDEATRRLATGFYDRRRTLEDSATALTLTQREMIAEGAVPGHWAGFSVFGRP